MKYLILMLLSLYSFSVFGDFKAEVVAKGLNKPWGVTQLPDGRFLITEKDGYLRIVNDNGDISKAITGLPAIAVIGQGGLMDVVLHPRFSENQLIYFSFVAGSAKQGYGTEVMSAKLEEGKLTNQTRIFTALPKVKGGYHFGSRLVFDKANYLYISLGDRGRRKESQNLNSHIGSIVRLHADGSVPSDNPFVLVPKAKPEIFSYGHRNVQGLALNPVTGQVWAHEHGPQGGDEVNLIQKGRNYGWPTITYGAEYVTGFKIGKGTQEPGMEQPIYFWDPSIAPSGMTFFQGDLFLGALKYQLLAQLTLKNKTVVHEKRLLEKRYGRIRDVKAFGDKTLYLLSDGKNGKLIRLIDSSAK